MAELYSLKIKGNDEQAFLESINGYTFIKDLGGYDGTNAEPGVNDVISVLENTEEVVAYALTDLDDRLKKTNDMPLIEVTYSNLKNLKNGLKLIPGMQYRITDYQTTVIQENTQSAGHQFDIIVIADSKNTINEHARAIIHSGDTYFNGCRLEAWDIRYHFDNDNSRFEWADFSSGKGVIYYMKDEFGNECPYDFKNIMFRRWWNSDRNLWCDVTGSTGGVYAYTFSSSGNSSATTFTDTSLHGATNMVFNNEIKEYVNSNKIKLNNNIFFGNSCNGNVFSNDCYKNTIGEHCCGNTFNNDCISNTLCSFSQNILFDNGVQFCDLYGDTVSTELSTLRNIKIACGTKGSSTSRLSVSVAPDLGYETMVAMNSGGILKIYCEADLIA